MTDIQRCPRSSYPDHNKKKYDYSRDANIHSYFAAANEIGVNPLKAGSKELSSIRIKHLIDCIISSTTIHEMTVYNDVLWDAYDSYQQIVDLIGDRIVLENYKNQEKLTLVIKYLMMHKGLNRREILGKHYTEISKDADYYSKVAEKANYLIATVIAIKP